MNFLLALITAVLQMLVKTGLDEQRNRAGQKALFLLDVVERIKYARSVRDDMDFDPAGYRGLPVDPNAGGLELVPVPTTETKATPDGVPVQSEDKATGRDNDK